MVQCCAKAKTTGKRCRLSAAKGSDKCKKHAKEVCSGAAPAERKPSPAPLLLLGRKAEQKRVISPKKARAPKYKGPTQLAQCELTKNSGCRFPSPLRMYFALPDASRMEKTPYISQAALLAELNNRGISALPGAECQYIDSLYPIEWFRAQDEYITNSSEILRWAIEVWITGEATTTKDYGKEGYSDVRVLEEAMQRAPKLPKDITLWRGISFGDKIDPENVRKIAQQLADMMFVQPKPFSTSISTLTAVTFADHYDLQFATVKSLMMEIKVKAGTPCLFIGWTPIKFGTNEYNTMDEAEVIMPAGKYEIVDVISGREYSKIEYGNPVKCVTGQITTVVCQLK